MNDALQYFRIARDLNKNHHAALLADQLHFRGNFGSYSLVSVDQKTPELGISGLKDYEQGRKLINGPGDQVKKIPGRPTPEKRIQAYIIGHALHHAGVLPFADLLFVTSELALNIGGKQKMVNDILALGPNGELVIIELKSDRSNHVKEQAIKFEAQAVLPNKSLFQGLVLLMTGKTWSAGIRKIAVWPAPSVKARPNKRPEVELYNYRVEGDLATGGDVTFEREK